MLRGASEVISRMPPERDPLPPEQIALIERWIDEGAIWPDEHAGTAEKDLARPLGLPAAGASASAGNARHRLGRLTTSIGSSWRGWRPRAWRLRPRPTRQRLLRRLSLDLIGLPPTIAEVDAFLANDSPNA